MDKFLHENLEQLETRLAAVQTNNPLEALKHLSGREPTDRQVRNVNTNARFSGKGDLQTVASIPEQVHKFWSAACRVYPSIRIPAYMIWEAIDVRAYEYHWNNPTDEGLMQRLFDDREERNVREFLDEFVADNPETEVLRIFRKVTGRDPRNSAWRHYTDDFRLRGYNLNQLEAAIVSGMAKN